MTDSSLKDCPQTLNMKKGKLIIYILIFNGTILIL